MPGKVHLNDTSLRQYVNDNNVSTVHITMYHFMIHFSQQKQLLNLLAKLDPAVSQSVSVPSKVQPTIAFGSPESSPTDPLSPRDDVIATSVNTSTCLEVKIVIQSNWGHPSEIGLTEVSMLCMAIVYKGPFTHRKIFFGQEYFFCLEPISCAWELTRQRKIVCPRKIFLCVNGA